MAEEWMTISVGTHDAQNVARNSEIRKLILYHFRRSRIGEVEQDTIEFSAILEKDNKRVRVGQHYTDGTLHKPRDIFNLLESGWKLILVESCYKWVWTSRRYISRNEWSIGTQEDCYGRPFVTDTWCGWYDKVDVVGKGRFEEKLFHNAETGAEKTKFGVPDDIEKLIEQTEWLELRECSNE